MSESVWFEQIDTALKPFIQSIVPSPRDGSVLPVFVRKPDEDFKIETYPSITFSSLYSVPDEFRHHMDTVIVDLQAVENKVILEESAVPYNLFYQVDFWSNLKSHMNEMTMTWLGKLSKRWFNLDVVDTGGNPRNVFCLQKGNLITSDLLSDSNRIFHSTLTYRIYVELDENIKSEFPMIKTVESP